MSFIRLPDSREHAVTNTTQVDVYASSSSHNQLTQQMLDYFPICAQQVTHTVMIMSSFFSWLIYISDSKKDTEKLTEKVELCWH